MKTKSVLFLLAAFPFLIRLFLKLSYSLLSPTYPVQEEGLVLITGTSTGIGNATVYDIVDRSKFVVIAGVRSAKNLQRWKDVKHERIVPLLLDVTDHKSVTNAFNSIKDLSKRLSLSLVSVINNAAVSYSAPFEFYPLDNIKQVYNVNVLGVMDVTQQAIPLLRQSNGRVMIISSVAGTVCVPVRSIYCSSKFAIEGWADALRRELQGVISVILIQPGLVKSHMALGHANVSNKMLGEYRVNITQARETYPHIFSSERQKKASEVIERYAGSPYEVSKVILEALSASKPHPRYQAASVMALPAWLAVWITWAVPDYLLDVLFR